MNDTRMRRELALAGMDVLEKMFFLNAVEQPVEERNTASGDLVAEISFQGNPPGRFRMELPRPAAASIAGNFLGEDPAELSPRQIDEVTRELANMICGAALSRIESEAVFRLSEPRILTSDPEPARGLSCALDTGDGAVFLTIETGEGL